MHTFKEKLGVYIGQYSHHDAESLQRATGADGLTFWPEGTEINGYTLVGHADATVTIAPADRIIGNKVASLRAELERDRAESQRRQNEMIDKINKLEALTYEAVA